MISHRIYQMDSKNAYLFEYLRKLKNVADKPNSARLILENYVVPEKLEFDKRYFTPCVKDIKTILKHTLSRLINNPRKCDMETYIDIICQMLLISYRFTKYNDVNKEIAPLLCHGLQISNKKLLDSIVNFLCICVHSDPDIVNDSLIVNILNALKITPSIELLKLTSEIEVYNPKPLLRRNTGAILLAVYRDHRWTESALKVDCLRLIHRLLFDLPPLESAFKTCFGQDLNSCMEALLTGALEKHDFLLSVTMTQIAERNLYDSLTTFINTELCNRLPIQWTYCFKAILNLMLALVKECISGQHRHRSSYCSNRCRAAINGYLEQASTSEQMSTCLNTLEGITQLEQGVTNVSIEKWSYSAKNPPETTLNLAERNSENETMAIENAKLTSFEDQIEQDSYVDSESDNGSSAYFSSTTVSEPRESPNTVNQTNSTKCIRLPEDEAYYDVNCSPSGLIENRKSCSPILMTNNHGLVSERLANSKQEVCSSVKDVRPPEKEQKQAVGTGKRLLGHEYNQAQTQVLLPQGDKHQRFEKINPGLVQSTPIISVMMSTQIDRFEQADPIQRFYQRHYGKLVQYIIRVSKALPFPTAVALGSITRNRQLTELLTDVIWLSKTNRNRKCSSSSLCSQDTQMRFNATPSLVLYFSCSKCDPNCIYSGEDARTCFKTNSKYLDLWMQLLILRVQVQHGKPLSSSHPTMRSLRYLWSLITGNPADATLRSRPNSQPSPGSRTLSDHRSTSVKSRSFSRTLSRRKLGKVKSFFLLATRAFPSEGEYNRLAVELNQSRIYELFEKLPNSTSLKENSMDNLYCFICTAKRRTIQQDVIPISEKGNSIVSGMPASPAGPLSYPALSGRLLGRHLRRSSTALSWLTHWRLYDLVLKDGILGWRKCVKSRSMSHLDHNTRFEIQYALRGENSDKKPKRQSFHRSADPPWMTCSMFDIEEISVKAKPVPKQLCLRIKGQGTLSLKALPPKQLNTRDESSSTVDLMAWFRSIQIAIIKSQREHDSCL